MQEESNPIKDTLFDYLKSEKKIQEWTSQLKFTEIIEDVLKNFYDKIVSMGEKEEGLGIIATGLLHYILTNALISSQRKIEHDGIQIDIVIPNLKTLDIDPKKTLIICIPKTDDKNSIKQKLDQLEKIQPIKDNIWLVVTEKPNFQNKTYIIDKNSGSFSKIIYDIGQFVNVQGDSKFKILRI
ncbi:MAG TPA: hypothetical protein VLD64_02075 [Nitrosarchaeum sp.]|nr:hypothetical protein [Nitrosarchaeum sp.]